MNTIQPYIRKKWLELLAAAQIAIIILVVGSPQPINSQIPPDASATCSFNCSGGGCSITVVNHVECMDQPDHGCTFISNNCSCKCSCGSTLEIELPDGGTSYQYFAHYHSPGSCGLNT